MELKLFYMGATNGLSDEQSKIAEEFINAQMYASLATNNPETGARISNLSNMPEQKATQLFYGTDTQSQKIANIKADGRCEVMYTDGNSQLMLAGKAEIVNDLEIKKSMWTNEMQEHFPDGVEGESFCLIKFIPESARIMLA